jgi:phosphoribosylformylglycinamidine (FGAM) synthase PurS component
VVDVMLKPEILDPQGQAIERAVPSLGVAGMRVGNRAAYSHRGAWRFRRVC